MEFLPMTAYVKGLQSLGVLVGGELRGELPRLVLYHQGDGHIWNIDYRDIDQVTESHVPHGYVQEMMTEIKKI